MAENFEDVADWDLLVEVDKHESGLGLGYTVRRINGNVAASHAVNPETGKYSCFKYKRSSVSGDWRLVDSEDEFTGDASSALEVFVDYLLG